MKTINVTIKDQNYISNRGTVFMVKSKDDLAQVQVSDTITAGGVPYEIKFVDRPSKDKHHFGLVLVSQKVPDDVPTDAVITLKTEEDTNAQD